MISNFIVANSLKSLMLSKTKVSNRIPKKCLCFSYLVVCCVLFPFDIAIEEFFNCIIFSRYRIDFYFQRAHLYHARRSFFDAPHASRILNEPSIEDITSVNVAYQVQVKKSPHIFFDQM